MAASSSSEQGLYGLGSLLTMPFVIINMGTEMMYILEQRLQAQSIAAEKSRKGEQRCDHATRCWRRCRQIQAAQARLIAPQHSTKRCYPNHVQLQVHR